MWGESVHDMNDGEILLRGLRKGLRSESEQELERVKGILEAEG